MGAVVKETQNFVASHCFGVNPPDPPPPPPPPPGFVRGPQVLTDLAAAPPPARTPSWYHAGQVTSSEVVQQCFGFGCEQM